MEKKGFRRTFFVASLDASSSSNDHIHASVSSRSSGSRVISSMSPRSCCDSVLSLNKMSGCTEDEEDAFVCGVLCNGLLVFRVKCEFGQEKEM